MTTDSDWRPLPASHPADQRLREAIVANDAANVDYNRALAEYQARAVDDANEPPGPRFERVHAAWLTERKLTHSANEVTLVTARERAAAGIAYDDAWDLAVQQRASGRSPLVGSRPIGLGHLLAVDRVVVVDLNLGRIVVVVFWPWDASFDGPDRLFRGDRQGMVVGVATLILTPR